MSDFISYRRFALLLKQNISPTNFCLSLPPKVFHDGQVSHYLDGKDEINSSWMRFVHCARHKKEQNMVVFQYHGCVYYRTIQDILPGQELLVWYDSRYSQFMGVPVALNDSGSRGKLWFYMKINGKMLMFHLNLKPKSFVPISSLGQSAALWPVTLVVILNFLAKTKSYVCCLIYGRNLLRCRVLRWTSCLPSRRSHSRPIFGPWGLCLARIWPVSIWLWEVFFGYSGFTNL